MSLCANVSSTTCPGYRHGMRVGVKAGVWGWSLQELEGFWTTAEEAGFAHISCFDHPIAAPAGRLAWAAPALLVAMAARTSRPQLCVDVLVTSWRRPLETAGEISVAQAVSGGRIEVGLGAGTSRLSAHVHAALGQRFPPRAERLARLEGFCRVLPPLWRGEQVSDDLLGLDHVALGPPETEPPPLLIGGASEAILTLVARHADGWNNAQEADPVRYEALRARLEAACERENRQRPLLKVVQLAADDLGAAQAAQLVTAFEAAGADAITFAFIRAPDPQAVRRFGNAVLS
jgi:alkanesulfonate monooxygenase SsuD/methylene tetrahydromethanopterin reductase-like flavin-dependent oxidoreductase (luciferase family)